MKPKFEGTVTSFVKPIKIPLPTCSDCRQFDLKNRRFTEDCYGCKRYYADMYNPRPKGKK